CGDFFYLKKASMTKDHNLIGVFLAVLGYFCYTVADTGLKFAGQDMEFYQIAFFTQGIGIALLVAFALATKRSLKTYHLKYQILRSIAYAICYGIVIVAFQYKSLAEVYTLFYINPFMAAILSWIILKEPIGKHRLMAVIVGFIGVLIILRPGMIAFDWISICTLVASTLFAYGNVLIKKIGDTEPILSFTFYTTGAIFLMYAIPFALNPAWPDLEQFGFLAISGGFETFATGILAIAYLKTHAVTISKLIYTSLIWAFLWGWLFFDDVLVDIWTGIGATFIIGSGLYMIYREQKHMKEEQA
ncbi:MAG: DMT family transporter, partial [Pseudomonadota bacterium]